MPVEFSVAEWSSWIPHTKLSSHPPERNDCYDRHSHLGNRAIRPNGWRTYTGKASKGDSPHPRIDCRQSCAAARLVAKDSKAEVIGTRNERTGACGNYFSHSLQL